MNQMLVELGFLYFIIGSYFGYLILTNGKYDEMPAWAQVTAIIILGLFWPIPFFGGLIHEAGEDR